jgi:glycosyltransferase involved in cell wall biosynthesis
MNNILILCDMFPPAFGPRMGYLCKYLKINGWNPVVVTEFIDDNTFSFLASDIDITCVRFYKKKGWAGKIEWGIVMLADLLFDYKNRKIYNIAAKQIEKQYFSLILCSSYRTFPLPAASKLARKTKLPLVTDLRDIIEQYSGNEFITHRIPNLFGIEKLLVSCFKKRNLKVRNKALTFSTHITTVSPWHVLVLKRYNPNVSLIYNGYDLDLFYPADIEEDKFYVTYTGRLLSTEMRNPDLLFQAVKMLVEEGSINAELFRIRWFTDKKSEEIIEKELEKYPSIKEYNSFYGSVPAKDIPKVLNSSSVLLLLTNKSGNGGPNGIMTTKFFEALAVRKPILCVRGDEGTLEEAINKTRSGLSAHNVKEVHAFLKERFLSWQTGNPVSDKFNNEEIIKYSRSEQALQFISIFEKLIKKSDNG